MRIAKLFPSAVGVFDLPNCETLNKNLENYALNLQSNDSGQVKSNVGGWHSSDINTKDLPNNFEQILCSTVVNYLTECGYKKLSIKIMNSWFIINNDGDFNVKHCHPRAFISGVYYVKVPENSSPIYFHDPKSAKVYSMPNVDYEQTEFLSNTLSFPAKAGRFYIFPGWLEHSVPVNHSIDSRIAFSFNFIIRE